MQIKRWYQDWLGWVIVVSITYGIICLASLASDVGRPYPGFFTYYNTILSRMEVEWNVPSWWWDTSGQHPNLGDVVIQVDDTPFTNIHQPIAEGLLYQTAKDNGQTAVAVTVERGGQHILIHIPLETFSWAHYIDLMLLPVIMATCYWMLAIILYRSSNQENKQRLVILLLCAIGTLAAAVKGALFIFGSWRETTLLLINPIHSLTGTFMGVLLLQLAFQFPLTRWPRLMRFTMPFFYGASTVLYLFYFSGKITTWRTGTTPLAQWMDRTWFNFFQYLIIFGTALVLARLFGEALLVRSKTRERQEARILLVAFILFLPAVWFAINGISGTSATLLFLQSLADTRFLSLIVPFAFAAISLRYHTFDGAEKWLFIALVLAVSGFLANAATAVLFWQSTQTIRTLPFPPTAVFFLLFLLVSLVWGWQSGWRGWLGRVFQWERVSYHEVLTFGSRLSTSAYADERQLAQAMADALCAALGVIYATVWLAEPTDLTLTAVSGSFPEKLIPKLQKPSLFPTQPIRLTTNSPAWLQPCYPETAVILPLTISGKAAGLIGLGPRWDTAVFDDRDLEILDLIAQQAAIFLHNARQTALLYQSDQQLLHIQELTRQKTAQNLHDHLLPALSQLQLKLLTANQLLAAQPEKAHALLAESQQELRENSDLVRRIQKDLVIRPLEFGLTPYLQELTIQFTQDTGIATQLNLPETLDTVITVRETREAIYAVWQHALDNIRQHAQATQVTANMAINSTNLTFSICDNGRGSAPEELQKAVANGRFGLRSMQIRLEAIGGTFAFQSPPTQGSCVQAQIPLKHNA